MDEATRAAVARWPAEVESAAEEGAGASPGERAGAVGGYALRKAVRYALVMLAIITINFALPRLMPGDPVVNLLGEYGAYDAGTLAEVRERLGLDGPLHEQFWRYLSDLARGEWGFSYAFMRPVREVLLERAGWTLLLLLPAVGLGVALALPLGALAGWRRGSRLDTALTAGALFVHCLPHYWLAMLALMIFAVNLGLFPLGRVPSGSGWDLGSLVGLLRHLALPLLVLTLLKAAYDFVIVRNSVITASAEDHVLAARARGISTSAILIHHVVRNSLAPLVTVTALQFGSILAGALLVEVVFSWPGLGTVMYDAIGARDYPLLQAILLVTAACVLVANFVADLLYARLDPRVR